MGRVVKLPNLMTDTCLSCSQLLPSNNWALNCQEITKSLVKLSLVGACWILDANCYLTLMRGAEFLLLRRNGLDIVSKMEDVSVLVSYTLVMTFKDTYSTAMLS